VVFGLLIFFAASSSGVGAVVMSKVWVTGDFHSVGVEWCQTETGCQVSESGVGDVGLEYRVYRSDVFGVVKPNPLSTTTTTTTEDALLINKQANKQKDNHHSGNTHMGNTRLHISLNSA
jgi:hypothetical protein